MKSNKDKGIEYFHKRDFVLAQFYLSIALQKDSNNKELQFLSLLSSIAVKDEQEACAIFEIYCENRDKKESIDFSIFDKIFDINEYIFYELQQQIEVENGINFDDFLLILKNRNNFKETVEDLLLSSRLFITKKADFIIFLDLLLSNGYKDIFFKYVEKALAFFPYDASLRNIFINAKKDRK